MIARPSSCIGRGIGVSHHPKRPMAPSSIVGIWRMAPAQSVSPPATRTDTPLNLVALHQIERRAAETSTRPAAIALARSRRTNATAGRNPNTAVSTAMSIPSQKGPVALDRARTHPASVSQIHVSTRRDPATNERPAETKQRLPKISMLFVVTADARKTAVGVAARRIPSSAPAERALRIAPASSNRQMRTSVTRAARRPPSAVPTARAAAPSGT